MFSIFLFFEVSFFLFARGRRTLRRGVRRGTGKITQKKVAQKVPKNTMTGLRKGAIERTPKTQKGVGGGVTTSLSWRPMLYRQLGLTLSLRDIHGRPYRQHTVTQRRGRETPQSDSGLTAGHLCSGCEHPS